MIAAISIALGFLAAPLGLLPSILLFRGLANGEDASVHRKTAYSVSVWLGLAAAWSGFAYLSFVLLAYASG